jgi:hypothetical protein
MPQCTGEGSGVRQKPKTNLETDEFARNPPFSKIWLNFRRERSKIWLNFQRERWIKIKIENLEF